MVATSRYRSDRTLPIHHTLTRGAAARAIRLAAPQDEDLGQPGEADGLDTSLSGAKLPSTTDLVRLYLQDRKGTRLNSSHRT